MRLLAGCLLVLTLVASEVGAAPITFDGLVSETQGLPFPSDPALQIVTLVDGIRIDLLLISILDVVEESAPDLSQPATAKYFDAEINGQVSDPTGNADPGAVEFFTAVCQFRRALHRPTAPGQ